MFELFFKEVTNRTIMCIGITIVTAYFYASIQVAGINFKVCLSNSHEEIDYNI